MTGMTGLLGNGVGTWSVIHDGLTPNTQWCKVTWNTECGGSQPPGTSLEIGIRAANAVPSMALEDFNILTTSGNTGAGGAAVSTSVVGRYAQIRVRLKGTCPQASSPVSPQLCDLTLFPVTPCMKGDVNQDLLLNGKDIQPFVSRLIANTACTPSDCPFDVNNDGSVDINDVACFVTVLLTNGQTTCTNTCTGVGGFELRSSDCNGNGVDDATDIASGTSQDCNHNFIPDECDLNTEDPDGDGLVSADVNANGIPDECEPDCNHNGLPDDWDISEYHSTDINSNGIPDECEPDCNHNGHPDSYDIATSASNDCNSNGVPDECEYDCNSNGVPDDCDIASETSQDCNGDGLPDECDIALGAPFGSLDCNDNGVPDECDIATGYSTDANHNHIPDECEEGGMMAPGEGMMTSNSGSEDDDDTWTEFYDWASEQCWGPGCGTTGAEQFQAYVDELEMLGLPVEGLQISGS